MASMAPAWWLGWQGGRGLALVTCCHTSPEAPWQRWHREKSVALLQKTTHKVWHC